MTFEDWQIALCLLILIVIIVVFLKSMDNRIKRIERLFLSTFGKDDDNSYQTSKRKTKP
jgi:uncharacterized protein YoxC